MKRLLCALIALMLLGSFACAETLRVGMECNYAPYNWTQTEASDEALPLSGGGYADGYDVRIAKRVAEELGYDIEIVKTEWGRAGALAALRQHRRDHRRHEPHRRAHGHHRLHRPLL